MQVAITAVAIVQMYFLVLIGLTSLTQLAQDPLLQLESNISTLVGLAIFAATTACLLVFAGPLSRFALRPLQDESDAVVCWLTTALAFGGVVSVAWALQATLSTLAWAATFAETEPQYMWDLFHELADLGVGLLLFLSAARLAQLWRSRAGTARAPATPAG